MRSARLKSEARSRQRHPSLVHQRVEVGVLRIHSVVGNLLNFRPRHVSACEDQLSILPQQGVILDRQDHQLGAT